MPWRTREHTVILAHKNSRYLEIQGALTYTRAVCIAIDIVTPYVHPHWQKLSTSFFVSTKNTQPLRTLFSNWFSGHGANCQDTRDMFVRGPCVFYLQLLETKFGKKG
jgi:hypothetical protein